MNFIWSGRISQEDNDIVVRVSDYRHINTFFKGNHNWLLTWLFDIEIWKIVFFWKNNSICDSFKVTKLNIPVWNSSFFSWNGSWGRDFTAVDPLLEIRELARHIELVCRAANLDEFLINLLQSACMLESFFFLDVFFKSNFNPFYTKPIFFWCKLVFRISRLHEVGHIYLFLIRILFNTGIFICDSEKS